jgi:beta-glucosidase
MLQSEGGKPVLFFFLLVLALVAFNAGAQTDYPFRDPKRSDDARIADLLGRLTLQEKVDLMDGHPKIRRLHLIFSDEAEGLHGLALGGPGLWGPRGLQPLPTTIFPQ